MAEDDRVYPIGFEDPSDGWIDEENALDKSSVTYARPDPWTPGEQTAWLVILYPHSVIDRLYAWAYTPHQWKYLIIEVERGGVWERVKDAVGFGDGFWTVKLDPPVAISKARFAFHADIPADPDPRISNTRLRRVCTGPLADICAFFGQVADFFSDLAAGIAGIMFVGDALSAPFVALAGFFEDAMETCCEASATLQDILDALEGGITPDSLLAIIQEHWPTLYGLITDPVGWFLVQLTLAFDLEPYHTQSLEFLAKWILEEYFFTLYVIWRDPGAWIEEHILPLLPELPDWLTDPLGWLTDMLEENFPLLYYLVVDPAGELLYLIGQAFDLTPYETQTGEFVVKALFERWFPDLYLLWRELGLLRGVYEREGAVGVMSEMQRRFYGLAERALRFLWEGEWGAVAETIDLWITGIVTEEHSPPIRGALVTVLGTGLSDTTDAEGRYTIKGRAVAAPSYNLIVTKVGFSDQVVPGVIAIDGVPTTVAIFMGFIIVPPTENPGPRLQDRIEHYERIAALHDDELTDWLARQCEGIIALQAQLVLYYGDSPMPAEYADLLIFEC